MKFSEINEEQWGELQPFLDTCLLPLTGLTGLESPWEVTGALERLRDVMDYIEHPFNGRVVTYPAIQYKLGEGLPFAESVDELCRSIRLGGFRYIILVTADRSLVATQFSEADLFITATDDASQQADIERMVEAMWQLES